MIDHDTVILQQPGKKQVDFGPAMTLNKVVDYLSVDIVLRSMSAQYYRLKRNAYLVRRHKVPQILLRQHELCPETLHIRRRRFRRNDIFQGIALGQVNLDQPRSNHHPLR